VPNEQERAHGQAGAGAAKRPGDEVVKSGIQEAKPWPKRPGDGVVKSGIQEAKPWRESPRERTLNIGFPTPSPRRRPGSRKIQHQSSYTILDAILFWIARSSRAMTLVRGKSFSHTCLGRESVGAA